MAFKNPNLPLSSGLKKNSTKKHKHECKKTPTPPKSNYYFFRSKIKNKKTAKQIF